jgi:mono/diheme cytochrome c family protein
MKFSFTILVLAATLVLAGCNFTLAEDIPPPPDYVAPTPMPTLGALHPASAPDVRNGALIYAERCAPCHGFTGLGDGPQSLQLPVSVPGIGLPEGARKATPATWFKTVTQGNLDRFMPPFAGALSDQERWDVVAYALTLHTTEAQLARGKSLVESDCPGCAAAFADQTRMAALSAADLVNIIRNGETDIPAFGGSYSDDDAYAAAAHLRRLTFSEPVPTAAETSAVAEASPVAEATPAEGTPAAAATAPAAGVGEVSGTVAVTATGNAGGLTVTLHGFDHGADQTSGPQEVLTISGAVAADGTYRFEDVEMPLNRIFLADVDYAGIKYRSEFESATADSTSISLPPVNVYEPSTDVNLLQLGQVHVYTDFATSGTVQVLEIVAFTNNSDKAVIISTDGVTIPFISLPANAVNQGYEAGQGSASFVAADDGLAVVPSDSPYSIIAFFNLPYEKSLDFQQALPIDTQSVLLLVPEGIKVDGEQFASEGMQVIENDNYQQYSAADLKSGSILSFTLSGRPRTSSATGLDAQQGWLIGGAALGLALILGGIFLYVRDRRNAAAEPEEADFQTADEVLDAILALDDLHRAGKISDEAHKSRRDELKDVLRQLS